MCLAVTEKISLDKDDESKVVTIPLNIVRSVCIVDKKIIDISLAQEFGPFGCSTSKQSFLVCSALQENKIR